MYRLKQTLVDTSEALQEAIRLCAAATYRVGKMEDYISLAQLSTMLELVVDFPNEASVMALKAPLAQRTPGATVYLAWEGNDQLYHPVALTATGGPQGAIDAYRISNTPEEDIVPQTGISLRRIRQEKVSRRNLRVHSHTVQVASLSFDPSHQQVRVPIPSALNMLEEYNELHDAIRSSHRRLTRKERE